MRVNDPRWTPLECRIEDGVFVIVIGVGTLAYAACQGESYRAEDGNLQCRPIDNAEFAHTVGELLMMEDDAGSTRLARFLDETFTEVADLRPECLTMDVPT